MTAFPCGFLLSCLQAAAVGRVCTINLHREVQSLFTYKIGQAQGSRSEKEGTFRIIAFKLFTMQVLKLWLREGRRLAQDHTASHGVSPASWFFQTLKFQ